jgi:hypothetical protein
MDVAMPGFHAACNILTSAEEDVQAAGEADSHDDATCWAAQAPAPSTYQDGSAGQILISGEE